ncbi:MAG: N-acetylmuramoyl-L-alanine amidase [Chloroflexota bacterium]
MHTPPLALRALLVGLAGLAVLVLAACDAGAAAPVPGAPDAMVWPPASATVAAPPSATPAARRPVVVVDPGHAVDEVGAAAYGVVEKESNLDFAVRVTTLLRARGVDALLTRTADVRAALPGQEPARTTGWDGQRLDLQARVDIANAAKADAFVSIHSNGAADSSIRGHEVYYNSARPFSAQNKRLATLLHDGVTASLQGAGLPATPRGVIDDDCLKPFGGRCYPLFILGPSRTTDRAEVYARGGTPEGLGFAPDQPALISRPSEVPAALVELLFVSSPEDAALLRDEAARDAMARGVARGILDFLGIDSTTQGGR